MFKRTARDTFRFYLRSWWRLVVLQLFTGILLAAALWLIAELSISLVGNPGSILVTSGRLNSGRLVLYVVLALLVCLFVCLPITLAGAAAIVRVVDNTLARRRVRLLRSFVAGFPASPGMFVSLVVALLAFLALFVFAPVISALGIIGLLLTFVVRLVRRSRPTFAERWPTVRQLVWMAVPFALAARWFAKTIFLIPASALETVGVIEALRVGADVVAGRRGKVVLSIVGALAASLLLQAGISYLGFVVGAAEGALIAGTIDQLLLLSLPLVVITVVFRLGLTTPTGTEPPRSITVSYAVGAPREIRKPRPPRRQPRVVAPVSIRRTAMVMPFVILVATLAFPAASAQAAGTVLMVNTASDDTAGGDVSQEEQNCKQSAANCTLRAALGEAAVLSEAGTSGQITVSFAGDYTVKVSAANPLTFENVVTGGGGGDQPSGTSGNLTIDGSGHNVVIDGQGASQALVLQSHTWSFGVRNLQISNGSAIIPGYDRGGGLALFGSGTSTVDSVTFDHDAAANGGGGMISTGNVVVTNSTFYDNSVGSAQDSGVNGGADLYNSGALAANNDTFVGSTGGSVFNFDGGGFSMTLDNSLLDAPGTDCTGNAITGTNNVVSRSDTSCPGTVANAGPSVGTFSRIATDTPFVLPLVAGTPGNPANAAMGAGGLGGGQTCTALDERGANRPSTACDAGAYEYNAASKVTLTSSANPTIYGSPTTIVATVELADGSAPIQSGTVQFSVDGSPVQGAVAVTANGTASLTLSNLDIGSHDITAAYVSVDPASYGNGNTTAPLVQKVASSSTTVALAASSARIAGTNLEFTVTVAVPNGTPTGTVTLTDTSGSGPGTVIQADVPVHADGTATIDGSFLQVGTHTVVASYSGDANNVDATSSAVTLTLFAYSGLDISVDHDSVAFGAPVTVTVTVPSSHNSIVPTGRVTFTSASVGGTFVQHVALDATGTASMSFTDLNPGSAAISVDYSGDTVYADSGTRTTTVAVTPASTATTLAVSPTGPIVFGRAVTLTAKVTNTDPTSTALPVASGTVTFVRDGTTIGTAQLIDAGNKSAIATYVTAPNDLPVGSDAITANYSPTVAGTFGVSASDPSTMVVTKGATSTTLDSDVNPATYGQPITFTATVLAINGAQGLPGGTVIFTSGTTELGRANVVGITATLTLASLPSGLSSIVATYAGTDSFTTSSSLALDQDVRAAAVTPTLTITPGTGAKVGNTLTLDVAVTPSEPGGIAPGGFVLVTDGSVAGPTIATIPLSGGTGTTTIAAPHAGTHHYVVVYYPSSPSNLHYQPFPGSTDYTIGAADTTTALAFSVPQSVVGNPVTLTATVANTTYGSATTPTGTVAFSYSGIQIGTAPVVDGVASLTVVLPESATYTDDQLPVDAEFTSGGDFNPSAVDKKIVVLQGRTTVALAVDGTTFGQPSALTATVAVSSGSGTPTGSIEFYSNSILLGTVPMVAGKATLSGLQLPAGRNELIAQYVSGDLDFLAPSPAFVILSVGQGPTVVTLTTSAGPSTTYGDSVFLLATVDTYATEHSIPGVAPTGTVTFTASGPDGDTVLGTEPLSTMVSYRATLTTTEIPAGDQTITATYNGDDDYATSVSDGTDHTVHADSTSTAVSVTPIDALPRATYAGEQVTVSVHVTSTDSSAIPSGVVQFSTGGTFYGAATLDSTGAASIVTRLSTAGSIDILGTYLPYPTDFAGSSDTATQSVLVRPTTLVLSQLPKSAAVGLGQSTTFDAVVTEVPGTAGITTQVPSGTVPLSDDAGDVCSATLVPTGVAGQSSGTCAMPLTKLGIRSITGSYSGDAEFGSASAIPIQVGVTTRTPTLTLSSAPSTWVAGEPLKINWMVGGPTADDGTVTVSENAVTVCTSTALVGSCDRTLGADASSDTFVVSYSGDSGWTTASATLTNSVVACVPYETPVASPADGGSVVVSPSPNCDSGKGFLEGTFVTFRETPTAGYSFSGWGGTTNTTSLLAQIATSGTILSGFANFSPVCIAVEIGAYNAKTPGDGQVVSSALPNCGIPSWTYLNQNTRVGEFLAGTKLTLSASAPDVVGAKSPQTFYDWDGASVPTAKQLQPQQTFTVQLGGNYNFFANFGVVCYHNVTFPTPVGGTASMSGTNCVDPAGPGYAANTVLNVSTHATGSAYFVGWDYTANPVSTTISSGTATVLLGADHTNVVAQYQNCVSFSATETGMQISSNPLGTVSVSPAGSCPNNGTGWYAPGTPVTLNAIGSYSSAVFGGWTGSVVPDALKMTQKPTFAIQASGTATGDFYTRGVCIAPSIGSYPAGALTVSSSLPAADPSCPAGMTNKNQPQELDLSAKAVHGDPLIGWVGSTYRLLKGGDQTTQTHTGYYPTDSVTIYGYATYAAYACEEVDPTLTLIWPDGTRHTTADPAGTDFIDAAPGPDCPFDSNAYQIGQLVFPQANGSSAGYTFKGFTGAMTSTSKYPVTPLVLDGSHKTVAIDAAYQVNCFTLTSNFSEGVEAAPAPNCPGTDPSENKYIGGTTVTLEAVGASGTNFKGFTGTPDGQSDVYAWTTMGSDEAIYADYESKSTNQKITEGLNDLGNDIAIASKKAVGVASAAIGGIMMGLDPVTAAAGLIVLLGQAIGAITGALGVNSAGLDSFMSGIDLISQTLSWVSSAASCVTVWSAAGNSDDSSSASTDLAGQTGAVIANAKVLTVQETTDAADKAAQAQTVAMAKAAEQTAMVGPAADVFEPTTVTEKALAAISSAKNGATSAAGAAAEAAAGPMRVAGRLGVAGIVGYSVYQEVAGGTGTGWDSSAEAAWTQGSDLINSCLASAVPTYLGLPPTTG